MNAGIFIKCSQLENRDQEGLIQRMLLYRCTRASEGNRYRGSMERKTWLAVRSTSKRKIYILVVYHCVAARAKMRHILPFRSASPRLRPLRAATALSPHESPSSDSGDVASSSRPASDSHSSAGQTSGSSAANYAPQCPVSSGPPRSNPFVVIQ